MFDVVRPRTHIVLRLPSDLHKVLEIVPNTVISIGKFGSFPANLILGRPYYVTYEVLEKRENEANSRLRVVSPAELNAEVLAEDTTPSESRIEPDKSADDALPDIVAEDGSVLMKNNRLTVDDASRQTLSMEEIEELKKAGTGSGKEIIERIMKAHTGLDEKTVFSLAKYTLRKAKKYLKRFTVLPMDVGRLTNFMLEEKDAGKVMDLREETVGLIGAWANVHFGGTQRLYPTDDGLGKIGGGRYLVVDETGGLLTAAVAEKMDILYPDEEGGQVEEEEGVDHAHADVINGPSSPQHAMDLDIEPANGARSDAPAIQPDPARSQPKPPAKNIVRKAPPQLQLAQTNTIHLIHANAQPNLSLLKYFSYDTNNPSTKHPLNSHLKPLTWLQLLDPEADYNYQEPPTIPNSELDSYKSSKKGAYYKKRRRWERCKNIVDETRAGGFDGLIVASAMDPATVLAHTVPLVRGAGNIVVYSPTIEPLTALIDLYSKDRKAAFLAHLQDHLDVEPPKEDFPVDPRLLLAPSLQTSRAVPWQVLPGRTHAAMTMRGASEGFVFTATRVLPVEGKVEARGNYAKKRKVA